MGPIGAQEMIAICVLALLLFGPKKLPELGKMLGKGLSEFRRAKSELKSTFESHMQELEREAKASEITASSTDTSTPSYSSAHYPYPYEDPHSYDETGYQTNTASSVTETAAPETHAVEGTVPRSSGYQAVESAPVAQAKEEHPA
jgi:sec-independent protein translocase protein TatA